MAQSTYNLLNIDAPAARIFINAVFSAIVSQNSGATAPSSTFAHMIWVDTANNIVKQRNSADDAWLNVAYLDQTNDLYKLLDDTEIVNSSGTQIGNLGSVPEANWETGTDTIEQLISPIVLKAVIEHFIDAEQLFTTYTDVSGSRAALTSYQNTSGKTMFVSISAVSTGSNARDIRVSSDNTNWTVVNSVKGNATGNDNERLGFMVPDGHYYDINGNINFNHWTEWT